MDDSKNLFVKSDISAGETISWDMFTPSSLFADEFIGEESEKNIIGSYVNAVKTLNAQIKNQNHGEINQGVLATISVNSLTIPFMFIARHTVELVIKQVCKRCELPHKKDHKILALWNDVAPIIKEKDCGFNDEIIAFLTKFIEEISSIDDDEMKTRYAFDNNGNLYNKKIVFINCENITRLVIEFSKLINVDFSQIKPISKNR